MKNYNLMALSLMIILFNSCSSTKEMEAMKTTSIEMNANQSSLSQMTMSELDVVDGLSYEDSRVVELNLNFISKGSTTVAFLQVDISGLSAGESPKRIYSGMTNMEGKLDASIEMPDRYRTLVITAKCGKEEQHFKSPVKSTIVKELKIP